MFEKDEELRSDLYVTPSDRVKKEESTEEETSTNVFNENTTTDSIIENLEQPKKEPAIRDSNIEVPLSPEDILRKSKKKRLTWFIVTMLINLALLGYIIYLVITIFSGIIIK